MANQTRLTYDSATDSRSMHVSGKEGSFKPSAPSNVIRPKPVVVPKKK